ncbi:MAG: class II glutamine amidotransferase [Bacteroidales bacterium]|nr:class II glutamine amidotransferase [Bacteroidales bacterium]
MSEQIKHECGIALVRLLKPLEYYQKKYETALYGLNKMYLLMEKQHNRGQDGAGVACIKFDAEPGSEYINRLRSNSSSSIKEIFDKIYSGFEQVKNESPELLSNVNWLKKNVPFTAELYLGHLRYGTFGKNSIKYCHPLLRQNNWITRNLVIAGNFNLTNVDELFDILVQKGQHPFEKSDTTTILEKIGHFLDKEVEKTFRKHKDKGLDNITITKKVSENLDILNVLKESCKKWDGGYVIAGMLGHGDAFVVRDPSGIRPAFYYHDDEVVVVTSERPAIQTAFDVHFKNVKELNPGNALIIKKDGRIIKQVYKEPTERKGCSFERIYFSRGTDAHVYQERKMLGKLLSRYVLKAINNDLENTVFSFIPNTAEVAFYGLVEGIEDFCNEIKKEEILKAGNNLTKNKLNELLKIHPRVEKIAVKDVKLRTFITQDSQREDLVAHVYDVTYGIVRDHIDTLVVIDDSIVRGTTLKQSIIRILDRLNPKKIIIVSSAPQIRYPDCYGIDMAKLGDFVAFQAAIMLLKERNQEKIIDEVYKKAKSQEKFPKEKIKNAVKQIYEPFTAEEISQKITEIVKPENLKAELQIIYQSIENLHLASPNNQGDWYFTGEYPTPGGNKVVNRSFINYIEGRNERAY